MKRLCLVLCLTAAFFAPALRAQEDDSQKSKPQEEIPDFSEVDQFIYIPKSTVNLGMRFVNGSKVQFAGNGVIPSISGENAQDATTANLSRIYHDGYVSPDARTLTVDNGDGTTSTVALHGADGKTNTWGYDNNSQLTTDGYMTFHIYSAQSDDSLVHSTTGRGDLGWELSVLHDMGNLAPKLSWKLFAGVSFAGISAAKTAVIQSKVTTTTDTYDLFGQTPPSATYNAPSSTTTDLLDSSGDVVTDTNGSDVTQTVDTTVLIGNSPLQRTTSTGVDYTSWQNTYRVHGAYVTFRFGPQLVYDITGRLHLVVSAGPAIVWAGSNYTVAEVFTPATGAVMSDVLANNKDKLMLGGYADLSLQFDLTDRTGFYFGSYYQTAGWYDQTVASQYARYTTRVDLENQQGLRTGMSYKF